DGLWKILRYCCHYFVCGCIDFISRVVNTPVAITGHLAANSSNSIGDHQRGSDRVGEITNADLMFSCIPDNYQCGANQTSVKSQPSTGKYRGNRILGKIVPVLKNVKQLCAGQANDQSDDGELSHPVLRPQANRSFFRLWQLAFSFFPPFPTHE